MKNINLRYLLLALLLFPQTAFAHPGPEIHDIKGVLMHWASGADHILIIGGIGLGLLVLRAVLSRSKR